MEETIQAVDDTLAGAPAAYRTPAVRLSLAEAQAWCKSLAETHYENFHVATWFLPKRLRPHFQTIYAYCRVSDDLGDEVESAAIATELLTNWRAMLDQCYDAPEDSRHPVFVALAETIRQCAIPRKPFADLLVAFLGDQTKTRYASMEELEEYSRYSANPVGRLVLYTAGVNDPRALELSDKICTGLQLANFWQDVSEDSAADRIYIPADAMERFGVTELQIKTQHYTRAYLTMMRELVAHTRKVFAEGRAITQFVDKESATTLSLFISGGEEILHAIERQAFNTLERRPQLSKLTKMKLLLRALWGKVRA